MNLTRIRKMVRSRSTEAWIIAERILRRREVSLLRRLNAANMPYQRKRLSVALEQIYYWQGCIDEKWACLHSASAADCAAYSDYLVCKGDWESRTGERWSGDDW